MHIYRPHSHRLGGCLDRSGRCLHDAPYISAFVVETNDTYNIGHILREGDTVCIGHALGLSERTSERVTRFGSVAATQCKPLKSGLQAVRRINPYHRQSLYAAYLRRLQRLTCDVLYRNILKQQVPMYEQQFQDRQKWGKHIMYKGVPRR